ncbi:MAG: peptidylprolyl isomerase [Novosphingobium sp.]|jgi:cyclophilin family peptidyl-prolyl cis-trans isomerase|uniref:peptidylprolyl isomerase n=1 Tax=Novosphingobium sp. TaxID=1874826 RepID=UPI00391AE84E|nr:peptidylprolyl isomerase [Novosphingobium sp.]
MRQYLLPLAALLAATPALPQASANIAAGRAQPSPLAPAEIVNAAKGDWAAIASSDLLVMDLAPDAKGKPRRVVIQLMPAPFSQGWVGNIRKLAAAKFWDGTSINRVQDNYVVQWGDATEKKPLPAGLAVVPQSEYVAEIREELIDDPIVHGHRVRPWATNVSGEGGVFTPIAVPPMSKRRSKASADQAQYRRETYGWPTGFAEGWPVSGDLNARGRLGKTGEIWPVHCYGMVGVGRDLPPNTGTGAELYTVIGHAPRHLDRNIALVGRVIEGIEHLSSLPRGTGALGFYETPEERTAIVSVRIGSEISGLPGYEYLSTESESFARYADARANRRDAFFIRPAGGADVCNIPVPVRRVK